MQQGSTELLELWSDILVMTCLTSFSMYMNDAHTQTHTHNRHSFTENVLLILQLFIRLRLENI